MDENDVRRGVGLMRAMYQATFNHSIFMAGLRWRANGTPKVAGFGTAPGLTTSCLKPLAKRARRRMFQLAPAFVRSGTFFETRLRRSSERGPMGGLGSY